MSFNGEMRKLPLQNEKLIISSQKENGMDEVIKSFSLWSSNNGMVDFSISVQVTFFYKLFIYTVTLNIIRLVKVYIIDQNNHRLKFLFHIWC